MMKYLIPILIVVLMAGGCRKKRQPEAATPTETAPPAAEAPAVPNQPSPPAPAPLPASGRMVTPEDIAAYNRELAAWINVHDEVPKTLEDLKKLNGLPFLPSPPPGRKYVYVPRFDRPTWSAVKME